jgi:hypothetical protein
MNSSSIRAFRAPFWLHALVLFCAGVWVASSSAAAHVTSPASGTAQPPQTTLASAASAKSALAASVTTDPPAAAGIKSLNPIMVHGTTKLDPRWQEIELHRNGAVGRSVEVTFGIPFPPGMLRDAQRVHIVDEHGTILPAHVTPSLHWYTGNPSIRAVRVQMHVELDGDTRSLRFVLGPIDTHTRAAGWPYADGLVDGPDGVRVPGVLVTLASQWMAASLIAGPQYPSVKPTNYDRYVAAQFRWARALPRDEGSAWLFDRPTTLFQAYVRTGRLDYLAAATESYRFYMSHLRRSGAPGWPLCGGGWSLGKVNVCDPKYVYIEPILLALGLTGDDSEHDDALIGRMVGEWDKGGWNFPAGPYASVKQRFTEREAGLGLLAIVSAYEITGDKRYFKDINDRIGWLYQHQKNNPDGLGDDGSWRNSWDMHEGNEYNAATDVLGSSPWMTENIIDALWHAWLVTGDARIPTMITAFGRYMERHGWIDVQAMKSTGTDWRDPCSGPDGQISWYWSSAHADRKQLVAIENSDGWYSDYHNVELMLPVAAARYFETDPSQQQALDRRLKLLSASYSTRCAENSSTQRRFNWNNRGTGVVQWFLQQPAGSGATHATAIATGP